MPQLSPIASAASSFPFDRFLRSVRVLAARIASRAPAAASGQRPGAKKAKGEEGHAARFRDDSNEPITVQAVAAASAEDSCDANPELCWRRHPRLSRKAGVISLSIWPGLGNVFRQMPVSFGKYRLPSENEHPLIRLTSMRATWHRLLETLVVSLRRPKIRVPLPWSHATMPP